MVDCVLGQLKPSKLYILSCGKNLGLRPRRLPQLRIELLGLYPILTTHSGFNAEPPSHMVAEH